MRLLDAGHEVRQFAMRKWEELNEPWLRMPFWRLLEVAEYDPVRGVITFGLHGNQATWRVK